MEAKDLMIGDWVQVAPTGRRKMRITWLQEDFGEMEDIQPIPLTDEILKQNGFKYFHKNYASLGYKHPFQLKMNKWPDENGLGGLWTICDMIEIRYVHELQHALRLCGIEKEIVVR